MGGRARKQVPWAVSVEGREQHLKVKGANTLPRGTELEVMYLVIPGYMESDLGCQASPHANVPWVFEEGPSSSSIRRG